MHPSWSISLASRKFRRQYPEAFTRPPRTLKQLPKNDVVSVRCRDFSNFEEVREEDSRPEFGASFTFSLLGVPFEG
jgi:hypothetical protein